ncbi:MAG: Na(+)-translocating NADH-quinone reductase subunit A [Prolixibacteraceae bacterium]|jgi:Na+-transporting NADH:ubiquinone oxidoreductase subunit A|nr:Na(+)-translocating NADH-quinone reductase subunit A [Prolixibacteraceae bacterium]
MSKVIKLKRGLNIRLRGEAEKVLGNAGISARFALKPTDFPGLIPKLTVKVDQEVKAGEPLFFDKYNPEILFTSPVSGKVVAVNRGERRKILEVIVEADGKGDSAVFAKAGPHSLSVEQIKEMLLKSGMWPFLRQRPYGSFAKPADTPRNIFISCFDSAPLAPDYEFILKNEAGPFQTGINALSKLTSGKVFLGLQAGDTTSIFANAKNVEAVRFDGPHPAGNVGIQIHHIAPLGKGDIVWTIKPQEVVFIGRLFETGKVDFSKVVALTGSEVKSPKYLKTILGTDIASLVNGRTKQETNERIISGNVLTGTKVSSDNYLGFFHDQVTVIPEGDEYEFMGWAVPGFRKFSASKTFLSKLFPQKEYILNANLHGGERAFVLSGQYEKFLPMDILPVFLLKAILANDFDKMEQLGIYEIIEEDLALCEYACTSKIKVQDIVRQGLDLMMKELG